MANRGDGHDENSELLGNKDNVVHLKVPRKKQKTNESSNTLKQKVSVSSKWSKIKDDTAQGPSKTYTSTVQSEPLINLPFYTKYLLIFIIGIHLVITFILNDSQTNWLFSHLGFIPGQFTGTSTFEPIALIAPLTHMFVHGNWLHIAMNSVMLLAFGAGVEKWLGGKKMLTLFIFSALFGLITHFILNFHSPHPIIGASGGLSGLFAVALVMLNRQNALPMGKYGFLPLILLWVGISVLFGSMGAPDGSQIAWAAHVGGFIGGFILMRWMKL